jgi:hypothetical protein
MASVGPTSDTSEKRAVLQALREGSFLLSILPCRIVSFSAIGKRKKKKRRMIVCH